MQHVSAEQIRDDLKGQFQGELRFDPISLSLFASDASIFQVRPLGVAVPRDEDDLVALVRYAASVHLPLIARGAGTGLAGESLGTGLILDFTRHFRNIVTLPENGSDWVRVQVGVVCAKLNAELAKLGRRLAPDPVSADTCTIGGMLATDAAGSRALLHGTTRDHLQTLRVVWDDGSIDEVSSDSAGYGPRGTTICRELRRLLQENAGAIRAHVPRLRFDRVGYRLHDLEQGGSLHLPRLLAGSEGTLGLFTEAVLRTVPVPGGRSVVRFAFDEVDSALRAGGRLRRFRPSACDLLDRRLMTLAGFGNESPIPEALEAVLLVEFEADTQREAEALARSAALELSSGPDVALAIEIARDREHAERLWHRHKGALPGMIGRTRGPHTQTVTPVPFVEDIGIPPEALAEFVGRLRQLLQRLEVTASLMAHVLAGQIHLRPLLNLNHPKDRARLWPIAEAVYDLTWRFGGTVSSQHGVGLSRGPWATLQSAPLVPVWRDLKAIFDPGQIFNPGKIVGPQPDMPAWPLRPPLPSETRLPLRIFSAEDLTVELARCNGCGDCRTEQPGKRMCPILRSDSNGGWEDASPRAKVNVLRGLLADGRLEDFGSDSLRSLANLCVNCRMCADECPKRVDVPRLMLEAKAAHHADHGLSRVDWVMARSEFFLALGNMLSPASNWIMASRPARWLVEKLFGISRHRMLPNFPRRTFLTQAERSGWTVAQKSDQAPSERVALFLDLFPNYQDPEIAEATVRVLQRLGIEVVVPPNQFGCGMTALAYGDVESAREAATRNVREFAELARAGYTIVCLEPTAALMLQQEYPRLCPDPDTQAVADRSVELTRYLHQLKAAGRFDSLREWDELNLTIGHHVPCHIKALGGSPAGPDLLALIPGTHIRTIDVSCSGMAGTFGYRADGLQTSLEAGRPMLERLNEPGILVGSTECGSCRMQMQHVSGKRTLHPVQYLALSLGLMPALADRLRTPLGRLISD